MNKREVEESFINIKQEVMNEWGLLDEDLDFEPTESEVNEEVRNRFQMQNGFDYDEVMGSFKKLNDLFEDEWEEEDLDWLNDDDDNFEEEPEQFAF